MPGLAGAGFERVSVEFMHEIAEGMHGTIVNALKLADAGARSAVATRSLPLAASSPSGCC